MSNFTESILNELENKENGSFQIKNENNHAVLAVFKPGKNGRHVTRQDVFQRLKLFNIDGYDRAQVEVIVASDEIQHIGDLIFRKVTPHQGRHDLPKEK